jgi:hypothetical protein
MDFNAGLYNPNLVAGTGLLPGPYDYIQFSSFSGTNPQIIVFKSGGSGGTTVATLTLTYDGSGNCTSITRT